jgi:hypothetical protein
LPLVPTVLDDHLLLMRVVTFSSSPPVSSLRLSLSSLSRACSQAPSDLAPMTKEWQEASEEYLKVCSEIFVIAMTPSPITPSLTHHRPKDLSPSLPTRACWFSPSPRRTLASTRRSTTSRRIDHRPHSMRPQPIPIPCFLESKLLLGTVCVQHTKKTATATSRSLVSHCHISPQCTEFRGICAFHLLRVPTQSVHIKHDVRIMPFSINALLTPDAMPYHFECC